MSVTDEDVHGPIDFVLIEFSGDKFTGEGAAALLDLVESGIVRIYDILVIRKDADGTFSGFEIEDLDVDSVGAFFAFEGARSGLLGDEDVAEAAGAMEPGTVAALIVYENLWAIPFVAATLRAGGQMIASQRIPALDVMAALDAIEAAG
jgi:hypothetical protein